MVLFKYIPEFAQVLISTLAKKISVQMGLASFRTHTVRLWNDRETGKYYCVFRDLSLPLSPAQLFP